MQQAAYVKVIQKARVNKCQIMADKNANSCSFRAIGEKMYVPKSNFLDIDRVA